MQSIVGNRIQGVMVYTRDLKKASEWYCHHLGFGVGDSDYNDFVELYMDGEMVLHLLRSDNFTPTSNATFTFTTSDIHEAYRSLQEKGVEMVSEVRDFSDHADFSFKDLDGNMLMIVHFPSDYATEEAVHELFISQ